jgi:hypothetical protein
VRLDEFTNSTNTPESNLTTALELIRHRYKDKKTPPKISTQSLINMVLNTDKNFNYDALVSANENNPALKNLIKSFNKDYVELRSADDTDNTDATTTNTDANKAPVDTVSKMAKRAGKKRNKSVF